MLGFHIEEEWKIDSEKRFEKFIFRTIDTSSVCENKPISDKTEEKINTTSPIKPEKMQENNPPENTKIKRKRLNSKKKNLTKKCKETLYELISITENEILLKKKKYKQV